MKEPKALRVQARSDLSVANALGGAQCLPELRAHVVAKYQQCVEKALKAAVVALRRKHVFAASTFPAPTTSSYIPWGHKVAPLVTAIRSLPQNRARSTIAIAVRSLQRLLHGKRMYRRIVELDALAPGKPKGTPPLHLLNTEYPFETAPDVWRPSCSPLAFHRTSVIRWAKVATDIVDGIDRTIPSLE